MLGQSRRDQKNVSVTTIGSGLLELRHQEIESKGRGGRGERPRPWPGASRSEPAIPGRMGPYRARALYKMHCPSI